MSIDSRVHVAVLMGGPSPEHEVSLASGDGVVNALDRERFDVTGVVITRDASWVLADGESLPVWEAVPRLKALGVEVAFIALHGRWGEDGKIQGFLDVLGLPYTGSGCAASALAMDKVRCKAVVQAQGIRVAGHVALDRATWAVDSGMVTSEVTRAFGFPCVVKPASQGSSVAIGIVHTAAEFGPAIEAAFAVEDYVMIEAFVTGKEVTCAVLDAEPTGHVRPLPVTEICPKSATWFDYNAKYTPGATEEITPAPIGAALTMEVQDMAAQVHDMIGCSGWSRSDFILGPDGPVWLEVNTVPGLTETSLYPQACAAAGIDYSTMVGMFVDDALRRAERRNAAPAR